MLEWKEGSARSNVDADQTPERSSIGILVSNIITTSTTSLLSSRQSPQKDPTANSQALVGTLLGAAAGAAIAYAMVKSETDPTPPLTPEIRHKHTIHQTIEGPPTPHTVVYSRDCEPGFESCNATSYRYAYPTCIRAIEAPPSPPSDYFSHPGIPKHPLLPPPSIYTTGTSETARPALRPPPLRRTTEPSTYSVDPNPMSSQTSRVSRDSHRSHSSRTNRSHSAASHSRKSKVPSAAEVSLPSSTRKSAIFCSSTDHSIRSTTVKSAKKTTPPAAFPLPASVDPSVMHRSAADFPPPALAKSLASSKLRNDIQRSTSDKASSLTPSPANHPLLASTKSSHHSRSPVDYPLPESTKTSLASHPTPKTRSTVSTSSASTVRPLTRAAVEKASTDIGDLDSVAPSDSVSQVSHKHRRRKHKHRDDGERAGGSRARSAVTEPAKVGRSIVTAFGLGR